ncbi:MAG: hypothetical protein HUJ76_01385 [Parasporobacterium sp.]|nr:hypothetical protein [Parasporobacterium sp.]
MTDRDKMQYIHYMQLKDELDNAACGGIVLKLDGNHTSAHSIASVCVFREEGEYMRDYIRDDSGCISELNFDRAPGR